MSDPSKLDLGDWLSLAVISIGGGVSSAMLWFKSSNQKRDSNIDALGKRMKENEDTQNSQAIQLNTLKVCQDNINYKLDDLKENIERTAMQGAHSVNTQIATLTNEIQKLISHNTRRGHE